MPFCTSCGQSLSEEAKFCSHCGAPTSGDNSHQKNSRTTVYDGEIHKCPHCGEVLKAFETVCPTCNHELRGAKGSSAVKELAEKLENASSENQRIIIIKNFPIPNTKEDILEFMLLASSNFDASYYVSHLNVDDESDAWKAKIELCYQKAKLTLFNQPEFAKIKELYDKIQCDIQSFEKRKKSEIIEKQNHICIRERVRERKKRKTAIITLCSIFIPIAVLITLILSFGHAFNFDSDAIEIGISSDRAKGQYYYDVVDLFESNGFTNIEARKENWSLIHKSDTVKSVTIDGKEFFFSFSRFSKDAKIIILYYD